MPCGSGVPVKGRGQKGVIMVLKHPQYGANPVCTGGAEPGSNDSTSE